MMPLVAGAAPVASAEATASDSVDAFDAYQSGYSDMTIECNDGRLSSLSVDLDPARLRRAFFPAVSRKIPDNRAPGRRFRPQV
jgi:hypothetical protein